MLFLPFILQHIDRLRHRRSTCDLHAARKGEHRTKSSSDRTLDLRAVRLPQAPHPITASRLTIRFFSTSIRERAIDLMPPSVETLVIIVDYASATSQTNPSVGTARKVLHILQSHYVERMGRAIVVRMPWWVNAFFTAISPFLDPVTKDKVRRVV